MDGLIAPNYDIRRRYLKPPSASQVTEFISELGVTYYQFERFYSMPYGIIKQVKGGYRSLPVKFWEIVYEKIVPQYGITDTKKYQKKLTVTNKVTKSIPNDSDSHDRTKTLI